MVALLPLLRRTGCRFLPAMLSLAVLGHSAPALAAHERPWLADRESARIVQTIELPGATPWKQALTLADGSVILLRELSESAMAESGANPYMMRVAAGSETALPFVPDWTDQNDAKRGGKGFHPVALATDEQAQLWLIDQGGDGLSPRLLRLDPVSGHVLDAFDLPSEGYTTQSRFTALAIHGAMAYLADEGGIALTAIDMTRHTASRFFVGYPTSRGHVPLTIDRQIVKGQDGHPLTRDLAYVALESDGQWLYELAPTGPIYRLSAALLTDPSVTPAELMEGVTQWRGTPTVSGIAIDDKATLYLTDISEGRLLSFDAARLPHILLVSPDLIQAGMPSWVRPKRQAGTQAETAGELYIPAGHKLLRIALP